MGKNLGNRDAKSMHIAIANIGKRHRPIQWSIDQLHMYKIYQ